MNERIQNLWEDSDTIGVRYPEQGSPVSVSATTLEAFAELVVQQCIETLMKPDYPMTHPEKLSGYNKGWVHGRLLGIEHIKKHFGVEE